MFRIFLLGLVSILIILPVSGTAENLFNGPESIAFDSISNRYFISNYYDGSIVQIDNFGDTSYFKINLEHCYGNCLKDSILYVTSNYNFRGFNINTGEEVLDMYIIVPIYNLDGVTFDTSGYLYALCTGGVLYRIDVAQQTYEVLADDGFPNFCQDIIFDKYQNRILVASYEGASPIMQVSLPDGAVSTAAVTPTGLFDGINIDENGYIYLASHYNNGLVYRYNNDFTVGPEMISSGYNQPAGLEYNLRDDIVAVPVFGSNAVDFIHLYVDFEADTLWGYAPLEVTFTATNGALTSASGAGWDWDFGDGGSDGGRIATHTYQEPGAYAVTVTIDPIVGDNHSYTRHDYIMVLADTLKGADAEIEVDTFEVAIDAVNNMPLKGLVLPCTYTGDMELHFLGYSVTGCRGEMFNDVAYLNFDGANRRFTLNFENLPGAYLSAGSGPLVKLQFEVVAADSGDAAVLSMDSYNSYSPLFHGALVDYTPELSAVTLTYIKAGCCKGVTGDADCSGGEPDISDITRLIDYLYISHNPLCCAEEGDVDASGGEPDISDITYLIDNLYLSHKALRPCP